MIIAVDFDGTCVTFKYPYVGESIGAEKVLKRIVANGHRLILLTMRCDKVVECYDGSKHNVLKEAVQWFKDRDIPLFGVNENPEQTWSTSRKVHADIYIDDQALFTKCKIDPKSFRCHVDWDEVEKELERRGVI